MRSSPITLNTIEEDWIDRGNVCDDSGCTSGVTVDLYKQALETPCLELRDLQTNLRMVVTTWTTGIAVHSCCQLEGEVRASAENRDLIR